MNTITLTLANFIATIDRRAAPLDDIRRALKEQLPCAGTLGGRG